MKDNLKIIGILTGVCMLCGFMLAFVFSAAKDRIEQNQREYIYRAIYTLAPFASSVQEEEIEGRTVYRLYDKDSTEAGYAFLCEGQGYQGAIKILFALDPGLQKLLGIEVIESNETPGLGALINEPGFKGYFSGISLSRALEVVKSDPKGGYQIQAITSATVSSKAVVRIVNEGVAELKGIISR